MISLRRSLLTSAVLLVVAMLAAAGCGGDDNKDSGNTKVPATLTVVSDIPYPPFEFGKPPYQGFDVDVVNEIAKGLGSKATFKKTPCWSTERSASNSKNCGNNGGARGLGMRPRLKPLGPMAHQTLQ